MKKVIRKIVAVTIVFKILFVGFGEVKAQNPPGKDQYFGFSLGGKVNLWDGDKSNSYFQTKSTYNFFFGILAGKDFNHFFLEAELRAQTLRIKGVFYDYKNRPLIEYGYYSEQSLFFSIPITIGKTIILSEKTGFRIAIGPGIHFPVFPGQEFEQSTNLSIPDSASNTKNYHLYYSGFVRKGINPFLTTKVAFFWKIKGGLRLNFVVGSDYGFRTQYEVISDIRTQSETWQGIHSWSGKGIRFGLEFLFYR